jgi:hypothetical protein
VLFTDATTFVNDDVLTRRIDTTRQLTTWLF